MNISPVKIWQWRALQSWERALFVVSVTCGVSYLLAPFLFAAQIRAYWPVNAVIKGLAVATLAGLAWRLLQGTDGKLLSVALVLSSLGDIFLAIRSGNYFVFGLLSFLVAHLVFIALWRRHWPQPLRVQRGQQGLIAALLLFLVAMLWWMLPIPGLSLPVAVYMCVLTTMVVTAALADFASQWVVVGAILFLLSDTLIALSTFKDVIGGRSAGVLIWSTYYLAQYLMTFGFLRRAR